MDLLWQIILTILGVVVGVISVIIFLNCCFIKPKSTQLPPPEPTGPVWSIPPHENKTEYDAENEDFEYQLALALSDSLIIQQSPYNQEFSNHAHTTHHDQVHHPKIVENQLNYFELFGNPNGYPSAPPEVLKT